MIFRSLIKSDGGHRTLGHVRKLVRRLSLAGTYKSVTLSPPPPSEAAAYLLLCPLYVLKAATHSFSFSLFGWGLGGFKTQIRLSFHIHHLSSYDIYYIMSIGYCVPFSLCMAYLCGTFASVLVDLGYLIQLYIRTQSVALSHPSCSSFLEREGCARR